MNKAKKIRVLIIDDSAVTRYLLTEILDQTGDMEVIAALHDPVIILNSVSSLCPDVIILDIMMMKIDGFAFLEELMAICQAPVVMVSALTQHGSSETLRALELGAVDYVPKQTIYTWGGVLNAAEEIISKVRTASAIDINSQIFLNTAESHNDILAVEASDQLT